MLLHLVQHNFRIHFGYILQYNYIHCFGHWRLQLHHNCRYNHHYHSLCISLDIHIHHCRHLEPSIYLNHRWRDIFPMLNLVCSWLNNHIQYLLRLVFQYKFFIFAILYCNIIWFSAILSEKQTTWSRICPPPLHCGVASGRIDGGLGILRILGGFEKYWEDLGVFCRFGLRRYCVLSEDFVWQLER